MSQLIVTAPFSGKIIQKIFRKFELDIGYLLCDKNAGHVARVDYMKNIFHLFKKAGGKFGRNRRYIKYSIKADKKVDIDWRIILKGMSKEQSVSAWTTFI